MELSSLTRFKPLTSVPATWCAMLGLLQHIRPRPVDRSPWTASCVCAVSGANQKMPGAVGKLASSTSVPPSVKVFREAEGHLHSRKGGVLEQGGEGGGEASGETVLRAFTRRRTPLAETEGASLSQQIGVSGVNKCPEDSSENDFLADRRKNRDRHLGGPSCYLAQSQRVQPNIVLLPELPLQPWGSLLVPYIYGGSIHYQLSHLY